MSPERPTTAVVASAHFVQAHAVAINVKDTDRGRGLVTLDGIDAHTLELITSRVISALREELEIIAAELGGTNGSGSPLTVDDVAKRLGVARSTVYAHWREWGGYKLGNGQNAAIRFSAGALPTHGTPSTRRSQSGRGAAATSRRSPARRRPILRGAPRLPVSLGDDG